MRKKYTKKRKERKNGIHWHTLFSQLFEGGPL